MNHDQTIRTHQRFTIHHVVGNAWHNLHGAKGTLWGTYVLMFVISAGAAGIVWGIMYLLQLIGTGGAALITVNVLQYLVQGGITILFVGLYLLGVHRARGMHIHINMGFQHLKRFIRLFFTWILLIIIVSAIIFAMAFVLTLFFVGSTEQIQTLIINTNPQTFFQSLQVHLTPKTLLAGSGLLTSFALLLLLILSLLRFSLVVAADKAYHPFKAVMYSWKIASNHWVRNFLLFTIINYLLLLIVVMPAVIFGLIFAMHWYTLIGIAISIVFLIWLLPYFYVLYGTTYHKLDQGQQHRQLHR